MSSESDVKTNSDINHAIVIIGGGTAGITVAAQLRKKDSSLDIAIIDPADKHYYQPAFTLVGGGAYNANDTERNERDLIPQGVSWIKEYVENIDADNNQLTLKNGKTVGYDYLIACPGIQIDWAKIKGLPETLGKNGVCSNYSFGSAPYTYECIKNFNGGVALFTNPNTPIKCGGAPQKIMYLASDNFRKRGLLDKSQVHFTSAGGVIFGVKVFAETLLEVVKRYSIQLDFKHNLVEVRGEEKIAVFDILDADGKAVEQKEMAFDMMHVTPPQSAPDFIKNSSLANAGGWVDINKNTMQHVKYANVFSLGDACGAPTAKTGAAVRKQAPVLVTNLLSAIKNGPMHPDYNGYSSCPLVTGYGKMLLAEFDYNNDPDPTFPLWYQQKEHYSMWILKTKVLPAMYWNGMLKGRA